jgi:hypothetical protein
MQNNQISPFRQAAVWAATLAITTAAFAAPPRERDRNPPPPPREKVKAPPPPAPAPPPQEKHFPEIKAPLDEQVAQIEKDLAAHMMRRGAGAVSPQAELSIDLRIIRRWCLSQAAAAKPESEIQIATLLRSIQLDAAIASVEETLKTAAPGSASRTQTEAMAQVHKISFEIGELKGVGQLDDLMKRLGYALVNAANTQPVDFKSIPLMRPRLAASFGEAVSNPAPTAAEQTRTVAELSSDITRAAISTDLRQQLLAVAKSAGAAAAEPGNKDAAALHQVLLMGVELAQGLSSTTAFTAQTRADVETQLSEGLALFNDPRTRDAGKARIEQLSEFRQVMNRVGRAPLPANIRQSLAPAFTYAQTHLDVAPKILGAIEEFAAICSAYDAAPKRDNPVANLKASTTEAARQVETARQAFITAANDPASTVAANPDGLQLPLNDLRQATELWAVLDGMQQTFETLNAYKPKPFGALESRAQRASITAVTAAKSPTRTEAVRLLTHMRNLAKLSVALSQKSLADVPPDVAKAYAGVAVADFEAKVKSLVTELITQLAAGTEPDKNKLARLQAVSDLSDSLKMAAALEKNLAAIPTLARWADFVISPDQANFLIKPLQQAMLSGFSGFMSDTPGAIESFMQVRTQYLPVLAFFAREAQYAEVCATMPEGVAGNLARLITPFDAQPFPTERYVSYAVAVSSVVATADPDGSQFAIDSALKRLRGEMRFSTKDLMPQPTTKPGK